MVSGVQAKEQARSCATVLSRNSAADRPRVAYHGDMTPARMALAFVTAAGLAAFGPATDPILLAASQAATGHERLTGVWVLDRDRSSVPPAPGGGDEERPRGGPGRGGPGGPGSPGGPGGAGPRGGGFGGGGGRGGPGGGFGGNPEGARMNPERMQAAGRYIRTLSQPSNRLTIVAKPEAVTITDIEGRSHTQKTDGKSVEEKAENGLLKVKRSAKWAAGVFGVTLEIEDGPKVERRYEVSEGGTELRVTMAVSGGRGPAGGAGRGPTVAVYTRAVE